MSAPLGPVPQGNYVPAKRFGDLVFVSGMTPRENGVLQASGKIGPDDDVSGLKDAVELATRNGLQAAAALLGEGESLVGALSLTVYVNAQDTFTAHSKVADFASALIFETFGSVPSRAAIGVSSLPGNAPVEVSLIMGVASS